MGANKDHWMIAGFTLLETLIVLALVGVVLALAIPSMQRWQDYHAVHGVVDRWLAAQDLARNEAMARQDMVDFCASADGSSCGGSSYAQGWIVRTAQGQVLWDEPPSSDMVIAPSFTNHRSLRYGSSGLPVGGFAGVTLTFTRGAIKECLVLARTGRVRRGCA